MQSLDYYRLSVVSPLLSPQIPDPPSKKKSCSEDQTY